MALAEDPRMIGLELILIGIILMASDRRAR